MRSIAAALVTITALAGPAIGQTTVAISCGTVGIEFEVCRTGAEAWAGETGNRVELVSAPASSTERLALFQQLLATRSGAIDVFQIDVVWTGILAKDLLDLSRSIDPGVVAQHFGVTVENNTVDGRLVAMPWFIDAGLLYYRQDLLQKYRRSIPETWEELAETARIIMQGEHKAGNNRMWGYTFQGRAYEGLTVNALEWLDSRRAGNIVEPDGRISVNNPRAAEALTLAASWVNTIAPPRVLNYTEEEARREFQLGNAVFMRNWPYAWPLVNDVSSAINGKVGISPLPRGGPDGKRTGVLGGVQLAVSRYSSKASEAANLVRYLTSRAEQKRRAIVGGFAPTISELFRDQEVLAAAPLLSELYGTFSTAVARPSGATGVRYNQVSEAFWTTVYTVLSGRGDDVGSELKRLERKLDRIMHR